MQLRVKDMDRATRDAFLAQWTLVWEKLHRISENIALRAVRESLSDALTVVEDVERMRELVWRAVRSMEVLISCSEEVRMAGWVGWFGWISWFGKVVD